MTADQLRSTLSSVSLDRYPELQSHTRDEIYGRGDQMSPGALFLAARMARGLEVRPGDVVLDVGCGLGESSIFLARQYGVEVVAVDLGIPGLIASLDQLHQMGILSDEEFTKKKTDLLERI